METLTNVVMCLFPVGQGIHGNADCNVVMCLFPVWQGIHGNADCNVFISSVAGHPWKC